MASRIVKDNSAAVIAKILAGVTRGLQAEASATVEDAKSRAPVRSGALRDGIHTETLSPTSLKVSTDDKTTYAGFMEFGTSRISPRPFMTPASESAKARLPKTVGDAIKEALR
jgi:HK97 gp10 family phage protein